MILYELINPWNLMVLAGILAALGIIISEWGE